MENQDLPDRHYQWMRVRARGPQKGLPQFRYKDEDKEAADAALSVRRWWWEFLRLSKDYWMICKTSGKQNARTLDPELARVYKAFGNIYETTFEEWWKRHGASVFQEQTEPPKVIEIANDLSNFEPQKYGRLLLEIPLSLSKATIKRQIGRILHAHDNERPANKLETSKSLYPINPVRFNLLTLKRMHEVWCLHRELILKPKVLGLKPKDGQEKADLYRIGKLLKLNHQYATPTDDIYELHDRQRKMRIIVSRYLNRANMLIRQVERGHFPVFKKMNVPDPRFSKNHLRRHLSLEEEWWNADLSSALSSKNAEDAKRIYYTTYTF